VIVAVGSENPTKLDPVKEIFSKHFADVKVVGVKVVSGVPDQPIGEDQIYEGALNRAKRALEKVKNADYGIGIEGGLSEKSYGWFENSLTVIIDKEGNMGVGSSSGLVLPNIVIDKINAGKNLEEAIDEIFGTEKIGEGIGMFGIMTNGVVTRSAGVSHSVAFALARFLHKDIYEK
jgi:inosine/xanthosine triphosphatase